MLNRLLHHFERWIDPFANGPANPPQGVVSYIMYFIRQAPITFTLALILGGLLGFVEVALFSYVGDIVDLLREADPEHLWEAHAHTFLWMATFVLIIRTAIMTLSTILDEQVIVPGFFNMVKWQNHRHLMRHSTRFFQDDFAGRLATKVAQSGQSLGDFLISLLQVIWLFFIYVTSALLLFADLNALLVCVLSFWCVLYAAILYHFIPRIRKSAKKLAEASAGVNGRLVDIYTNITLVKLDGDQEREDAFVKAGLQRLVDTVRLYTRTITGMRFSLHTLNGFLVVLMSYVSLELWQSGALSLGAVAFSLGLMLRLVILSQRMLGQFNGIFRAVGTIQNTVETMTQPLDVVDRPDATVIGRTEGHLVLDEVVFNYGQDKSDPVINALSLAIKPGEKIGLVGPSGAGKSTLIHLILRLYDAEQGTIELDGQDVKNLTQKSLRQNFSVVQQETALLNRSVFDNIAYARPEATHEEVITAAKKAHAHAFILALQDSKGRTGYDAHVGERGVKLSGGQRQRITLARVILKNAPILILDEATSALDSKVERAIHNNLLALMQEKTVIAIAHRLSTLIAMDRLLVLDRGKIVDSGTHEELLQRNGLYTRLWKMQSGELLFDEEAKA